VGVNPIRFVCEVPGVVDAWRRQSWCPEQSGPADLHRGTAHAEADAGPVPDATARAGAPRALVAEDDPEMRHLLVRWMRREGFEVIEAADGRSAIVQLGLAQLWQGQPGLDLVVSDVRMPGFSGLDVLEAVGALESRTPVILITGFDDPQARSAAGREGVAAVLPKPFDSALLRGAIQRAREGGKLAWSKAP
jgi:two-component system response regulator (stage 0 sporulation protein F)